MLFAYEDHVSLDSTTIAPILAGSLTNPNAVKTRQLAEIATGNSDFDRAHITFDVDRTVRFVAVLNTDLSGVAGDDATIELRDSGAALIATSSALAPPDIEDTIYTRSMYFDFGQAYTNVREVRFIFTIAAGSIKIGRLWAGPALVPTNIQAASFGFGMHDPSQLSTSRGGQAYADPYRRLRTMRIVLPALSQQEAFGNLSGAANIQDMLFTVGSHAELIIVPQHEVAATDEVAFYKWSLYGHFTAFSQISPIRPGQDRLTRLFEVSLNAIEER